MQKILDFSNEQVGADGVCKGLRADWNDCLNLGGGESALVSFLHFWALDNFVQLAAERGDAELVEKYTAMREKVKKVCDTQLWDKDWFIRGITKNGKKIGTSEDTEGKIHLESNTWAVLSGAATYEQGIRAMNSVKENLLTPYGLMLNAPSFTKPDDDIGFVTRVYPGVKENGAIFSHPNPWAWAAECRLGRGDRAMEFYNALCPYFQNDMIETRQAEPYSYCQFIMGKDHTAYGRARHPFMTGSGGWAYFSATRYMLGIRPQFEALELDPCVPADWTGFTAQRVWRDAQFNITVENPDHVMAGVKAVYLDDQPLEPVADAVGLMKEDDAEGTSALRMVARIPVQAPGTVHNVKVIMG